MVIIYQGLNKDLYKLKLMGGGYIKNVILMILLFYLLLFK